MSCFRPLRGRGVGRMQYAPTTGYVCPFEILMQFLNRVRVILRNTDAISQLGTYAPSKNSPVFVPFGVAGWGVCDTPLQQGTCGPSKNSLVFVPFGAARWAYSIRPYNRVHAIFRNTDAIPQSGMCEGSKNRSVFVPYGDAGWGVFDTPLRPNTCDPSKYRCDPLTGYVRGFKK